VVTNKWIFQHKFKTNDTLDWYKTHWVTQWPEEAYDKTFSPIMKLAIVRAVLTLVITRIDLYTSSMSRMPSSMAPLPRSLGLAYSLPHAQSFCSVPLQLSSSSSP
jgi:hypothetical protein